MFVSRLCFFRLVNLILGQGLSITICTLEGYSGTWREYLQIVGMWGVFFSSFTSWHYGYLCAFFRTIRDAGPRHRCVLVLQICSFTSCVQTELVILLSISPWENLAHPQLLPKSKTSSAISISVLHAFGAPIIFFLLIWGCAVWVFQERKFLMVLALPPSMGL